MAPSIMSYTLNIVHSIHIEFDAISTMTIDSHMFSILILLYKKVQQFGKNNNIPISYIVHSDSYSIF